jgi:threonine dehydratase
MSHIHFTAAEEYKKRVIQLGEQPSNVFNTGALGIESINKLPLLSIKELEKSINFKLSGDLRFLVTFHPVTLENIERFVDGAAVKRVGDITFSICKNVLDDMRLVSEGKICSTILKLYNEDAIVAEPAGALSIAALDDYAAEIKGKNVVCVVSGSNNDIDRMQEIKERSLQYEGLKHYFLIKFAQRPGALKEFVNHVLGPNDDITRFEYMQKTNKESGHALVGIELKKREDYDILLQNMHRYNINYTALNKNDTLFGYLV